mmetsp:Transcript_8343/g.34350  ORF Transcript_8343/g.34350 Transcript_8343/m.34350 type:complete len:332 (-) Transcript_8343:1214-2209(-)
MLPEMRTHEVRRRRTPRPTTTTTTTRGIWPHRVDTRPHALLEGLVFEVLDLALGGAVGEEFAAVVALAGLGVGRGVALEGGRDVGVGLLEVLAEVVHGGLVGVGEERRREAVLAGAARAADAVAVVLDLERHVVVDDVGDVGDVEAAAGDVGRDERRVGARLEGLERGLALVLRPAAVDDGAPDARGLHDFAEGVAALFFVAEHEVLVVAALFGEEVEDDVLLLVLGDVHDDLLDALVLVRLVVADRDDRGVAHELFRELLDGRRHRRREHGRDAVARLAAPHGLLLLGELELVLRFQQPAHRLEDLVDLRLEAHVDHAVRLVEDDVVGLI